MNNKKMDELLNSSYDGIQEYDNDLPAWWVYLFYLTIVFSAMYIVYVHFMGTPSDHERLAAEVQALKEQQSQYAKLNAPKETGPDTLLAFAKDNERVSKGQVVYQQKCLACHGAKGEGLVGPNLTDEFWIHGSKIENIHHVIEVGVPDKGMMAWKSLISQDEIDNVTAFIWSIRNTNVPGKAPQGEK